MAHRRSPLALALGLNTVVTALEVVGGVGSNSLSLIVDGIHNVSDEVALAVLVLAYALRAGLSGRLLRRVTLVNAAGLFAISAPLTWLALGRVTHPRPLLGPVPLVVGLLASAGKAGVARALRAPSVHDAAIRFAFIHNLSDIVVSLGPALAGALTMLLGSFVFDAITALLVLGMIIAPPLRTLLTSQEGFLLAERVTCGPHRGSEPPTH